MVLFSFRPFRRVSDGTACDGPAIVDENCREDLQKWNDAL